MSAYKYAMHTQPFFYIGSFPNKPWDSVITADTTITPSSAHPAPHATEQNEIVPGTSTTDIRKMKSIIAPYLDAGDRWVEVGERFRGKIIVGGI
jgi:hypothetical protein